MFIKDLAYYLIGCKNRFKIYNVKMRGCIGKYPRGFAFINLCRLFPVWLDSLNVSKNALFDQRPWLTFEAIEFVEKIITKDMSVYEYGAGGSTLFFARQAKEVISTEHDSVWYNKVLEEVNNKKYNNCRIRLFGPELDLAFLGKSQSEPEDYISGDTNYRGMNFRNYASSIDIYPDDYFDIILIDGRARPACFKHAKNKVKKGGFIILDDADVSYYSSILDVLRHANWEEFSFYGPCPYISHFKETCILRRSN